MAVRDAVASITFVTRIVSLSIYLTEPANIPRRRYLQQRQEPKIVGRLLTNPDRETGI